MREMPSFFNEYIYALLDDDDLGDSFGKKTEI